MEAMLEEPTWLWWHSTTSLASQHNSWLGAAAAIHTDTCSVFGAVAHGILVSVLEMWI